LTGGALPLAVTLATEEIFEAHRSEDRSRMFFHSSSYTANPIACAAAVANLAIWRDEPVLERIRSVAQRQESRLAGLDCDSISGRRQLGTITAMEIGRGAGDYLSSLAPRLLAFFRERDLLLRPLGNTVYVMPPYCIEDSDLDAVYAAIAEAASHFA
jgi:adenosylmethionine-8-amino-7-oxononanoate aminotransferase